MKTSMFTRRNALVVALSGFSGSVMAQTATGPEEIDTGLEEIIVTAYRREESLQDVVGTVTAVTSKQIQDLKLLRVEDVAVLSPGLSLDKGSGGFRASASLRGVNFDANSGATPTVDFYLNDVIVDPNYALNAMYDVGQIEVLRGPQGTLRGRPTPSGAVSIRAMRPSTLAFAGQFQATAATHDATNYQGGINIPLISDKLAVRVAGLFDRDSADNVRSFNNTADPYSEATSGRISVLATPTDLFEALLTYQHLETRSRTYQPLVGPGAGYNGPALASEDRRGVQEEGERLSQKSEFVSLEATVHLPFDADLVYVGGYQEQRTVAWNTNDDANSILNYEPTQHLVIPQKVWSHEMRLQSTGGGFLTYMLGAYYTKGESHTSVDQPVLFTGAFGPFGSHNGPPNPAYAFDYHQVINQGNDTKAVFTNLTFHITDRLEATAGARYNRFSNDGGNVITAGGSARLMIAPNPTPFPDAFVCGSFIPGLSIPSLNPGNCDIPIAIPSSDVPGEAIKEEPITYSGSIKYELTPDMNVYAAFGHSWRQGAGTGGLQTHGSPILEDYRQIESETSNSYEIGFRSTLFDRLQFNLTVYQQDYKNFLGFFPGVPYLGDSKIEVANFTSNADAQVRGVEVDTKFLATSNWDVSLTGSYARGKIKNSPVPCRDGDGDGVPDSLPVGSGEITKGGEPGAGTAGSLTDANPIATCVSNVAVSQAPKFSATLQSEYRIPLGDNEAYLRALGAYRGKAEDPTTAFQANSYFLLDMFTGVRIGENVDVGLFARNILDKQVELSRNNVNVAPPLSDPALPATGYFTTRQTPERQFGASVNYRW